MTIVIPMAGESSRFTSIGMAPKYTLKVGPFQTLFDVSVKSFEKWFDTANFVFVVKDNYAYSFAQHHAKLLGIKHFNVVNLHYLTRGQAESVYEGIKYEQEDDELVIFNIDTIRYNFELPQDDIWDTLFDAFYDETSDSSWSFCKIDDDNNILETAEKRKISSWCSTGLYVFRSIWLYKQAYYEALNDDNYNFYIAPLYNNLKGITNKLLICPPTDIDFSGTPEQYIAFCKKYEEKH